MRMRLLFWFGLSVALVSNGQAVGIDDTLQQVIAQKGQPSGRMQAGDTVILRYPDETIRLKAGKVVAVEAVKPSDAGSRPMAPAKAKTPASKAPPAPAAVPVAWTTNYELALADAKAQNRRVFLFFTGSDWCGWCMRLQREILTTPEFARFANEDLILVEIDYPRGKPQPVDVREQNVMLSRRYSIRGFPTVIVLDRDGRAIARLGYQEGGPGPLIEKLKAL